MQIESLLVAKDIKPKEKLEILVKAVKKSELTLNELLDFAINAKDAQRATCIEVVEYLTKDTPDIIDINWFDFVCSCLFDKSPRVIWEASKVIGNSAKAFVPEAIEIVGKLLANAEYNGTVVKWSTAYALSEIYLLNTELNPDLEPVLKQIAEREENNGVKNMYLKAFKKMEKISLKMPKR